ncbi:ankyrin repeat domain-containing protein [Rickettsiella endosymbiont of Rhagonycha lignosa]|uniref:ankyrin repeat domain-containing protein n=1 Tax=Rickettsiella endosymbiont of Rhagonycha lignosa TaxID=3077937 RepID=UPI00313DFE03
MSKFTETDLIHAVKEGDLAKVKACIQAGVDVNALSNYGNTALSIAAKFGEAAIVEYLIEKKANVNVRGDQGNTPLLEASKSVRKEAVITLLIVTGKADVTLSNNAGSTPLHFVASTIPLIKEKFKMFMNPADMETSNFSADNIKIINLLLLNGANANATNTNGHTPLENTWKINYDKTEMRRPLLEVAKVLIQAMLSQNPEIKKPKFFKHEKELSNYWDKLIHKINYLLENKIIGSKDATKRILATPIPFNTLFSLSLNQFFKSPNLEVIENKTDQMDTTPPKLGG